MHVYTSGGAEPYYVEQYIYLPGEFSLLLDDLQDTILHLVDGCVLGESQTTFVGDIVHSTLALRVLTVDTYTQVKSHGGIVITVCFKSRLIVKKT